MDTSDLRLFSTVKEKIVGLNFHLHFNGGLEPKEPTIFRAYKTENNKIIITKKEEYDDEENIFCNYLNDEFEMNEFFNGISIETFIMDNDTFGTHYPYGANPINEFAKVSFDIYDEFIDREIYFSDGMWYLLLDDDEDNIISDKSYVDRNDLIDSYVKSYLDDFFSDKSQRNIIGTI